MGRRDKYLVGEGRFEDGIGLQTVRECANKSEHGVVPGVMKTKSAHFGYGLVGGPVVKGDAVGGNENAGAVFAVFAVNENGLRRGFAEKSEKLNELR